MSQEEHAITTDFPKFIKNTDDLLYLLFCDSNLCHIIVDNNLLWPNINTIIKKYDCDKTFEIIKLLYKIDYSIINENMYMLFENTKLEKEFYKSLFLYLTNNGINKNNLSNLITHILINKCSNINYDFIDFLLDSEYKYIFINNFDEIVNNYYYMFGLKEQIKDDNLAQKYYNYINNNPKNLIYEIIMCGFLLDKEEIDKEEIYDVIKTIIDELLEYNNLNYYDIKFLGSGTLNYVILIGDKVLKVGKERDYFKINNHRRFLKPLLRMEINQKNSKKVLGCIEITEKVDTKNISEEDVYMLYKELRDEGYYWVDYGEYNVGRLLKDNNVHYKDINPVHTAINYNNENNEVLLKGDLVILDNDYIIKEEEFEELDKETRTLYLEQIEEFETRYKKDKRRRR